MAGAHLTRPSSPARCVANSISPEIQYVPDDRSHRDPFACLHRDHHHRSPEEGAAKRLAARFAPAATGTAAAGGPSFHTAFRAGARGSGHPGILVVADFDPH